MYLKKVELYVSAPVARELAHALNKEAARLDSAARSWSKGSPMYGSARFMANEFRNAARRFTAAAEEAEQEVGGGKVEEQPTTEAVGDGAEVSTQAATD